MLTERWIVQEWDTAYEEWFAWGKLGYDCRFKTYNNAKTQYEQYQKTFHYSPCMYRYCKIVIRTEEIINTAVHSTFAENGEEINLTIQNVEQDEMKFT